MKMNTRQNRVILTMVAVFVWSLPFSMQAFGSDIQTRTSPLYPYQSSIALQDDFISGNNTNGTVGALGWIVNGGSTTLIASVAGRPGLLRKDTTAASGTIAQFSMYSSASAIDPGLPHILTWVFRLNTNDANTTIRIGMANALTSNPPADGIYIEKLDADTNIFCVTRAGGVQTRTDSGVAVNTNFNTMVYTRNSSGVTFRVNGQNVCTHTTNIPTTFINPGLHIVNSAAASKTIDIDYFEIQVFGLSR